MTDKIVIIGGGIAGLYSALYFVDKGYTNIELYEASSRLGGHIYTHYDKSFQFETGGIRFNKYHTRLLSLLKRFKLHIVPLPKEKQFIRVLCKERIVSNDLSDSFIQKVIQVSKKYSKEELIHMTFGQLCDEVLGYQNSQLTMQSFGYNAEFHVANAYNSIEIFKNDFNRKTNYYACQEGLSELVKRIEDFLLERGIQVTKNKGLKSFKLESGLFKLTFQNDTLVECGRLILAIPKGSLLQLDFFEPYKKILESVTSVSLHRIFGQYKKPWFKNIIRTTTDLPLRHFIPMDPKSGLVQISYSDLHDADYWRNYANQGLTKLEKELYDQLAVLFPKERITPLLWLLSFYWKEGVHVWNVGYDAHRIREQLKQIHPLLHIVGESYTLHNGWIEGALESVDYMIGMKGGGSYKEWTVQELEEIKKNKPEFKWVIFKLPNEKQKRLIDVTEWMHQHPGGMDVFIDHMYEDITNVFNTIGFHYDQKIIKNHVLEKIKEYTVGYIKI